MFSPLALDPQRPEVHSHHPCLQGEKLLQLK